jgi:DNA-binding XRE family transcriptional regulator
MGSRGINKWKIKLQKHMSNVGITDEMLAKELDLDIKTIKHYTKRYQNEESIRMDILSNIVRKCGTSFSTLMNDDFMFNKEVISQLTSSYIKLSDELKNEFKEFLNYLMTYYNSLSTYESTAEIPDNKAKFGERLKHLRKFDNNVSTQEYLSQKIGCDVRTIRNCETSGNANMATVIKLAKFFNVSIDYLVGNTPYTSNLKNNDMKAINISEFADFCNNFIRLSHKNQQTLLDFILNEGD